MRRKRQKIPCFGRALVHVVDTIHIEVLDMPGEACEVHSHVDPGGVDARNLVGFRLDVLEKRIWALVDVVQVERMYSRITE